MTLGKINDKLRPEIRERLLQCRNVVCVKNQEGTCLSDIVQFELFVGALGVVGSDCKLYLQSIRH